MAEIWSTQADVKRILDPSAGTGIFAEAVHFHDPYTEITCFEKDPATGLILKHLHPETRVRVQGFENIEPRYIGYYDVAVSNIPFGDVALFDPFFSTYRPRATAGNTDAAQLFLYEIGRYCPRGRSDCLYHFTGRPELRTGAARARMADESLQCGYSRAPAEQSFFPTMPERMSAATLSSCKKHRRRRTFPTAKGFYRNTPFVERHPRKQPFPLFRPSCPYRCKGRNRPLRQARDGIYPFGRSGGYRQRSAANACG